MRKFAALFDTFLHKPPSSAAPPMIVAATPVVKSPTATSSSGYPLPSGLPGLDAQTPPPEENHAWAFRPNGSFRLEPSGTWDGGVNGGPLSPKRSSTGDGFGPAASG